MNFEKIVTTAYSNILDEVLKDAIESSKSREFTGDEELDSLVSSYKLILNSQQKLTAEALRIYHEKLTKELKKQGIKL